MSTIRRFGVLLVACVCASAVAAGQTGRAGLKAIADDAFGPDNQEMNIGAAAFQHLNNASGYEIDWTEDGYLTYNDEAFLGVFVAPLSLPAGAQIVAMCTFFYDTAAVGQVTTDLDAVKLVTSISPAVVPVLSYAAPDSNDGYGYVCDFVSYTFQNYKDVDGDGNPDEIVHRIRVDMTETGDGRLAFGGVKVVWRRQVSPAPELPTFGDVPPTDAAYPFVEALAASGITAGCSEDNYCPDAPLTRRQMAVFLAKALGLHWPY